jgi:hypothetical protein
MSSRHRTPAEIAIIVSQFHASGLSRRDFARRHDFSVGSLARWLQRQPTTPNSPKFVRVVPAAAPTPPSWFELALPDGRRLRIPAGCDESALRSLLGVLAEGPSPKACASTWRPARPTCASRSTRWRR